ncbi:GGDEF domain-containing protein [Psychrosphaera sp. F3M07]|uniref:GGDEF domain-containing protein n=1 Tax=Psychrosphaera sp. F3M07 TaxID=2841560 RepID=UPI001C0A6564|nr:GGDEF domain-containing protein [Psychrosphaera sp. F3M07]MBU2916808.1 GGDEF domain-containing protein [Psychrosphaera sp. F3M07]
MLRSVCLVLSIVVPFVWGNESQCFKTQKQIESLYELSESLNIAGLKLRLAEVKRSCDFNSLGVTEHIVFNSLTVADGEGDREQINALRKQIKEENLLNVSSEYFPWQLFILSFSYYWDGEYEAAIDLFNDNKVILSESTANPIRARLYALVGNLFFNASTDLSTESETYFYKARQLAKKFEDDELTAFIEFQSGDTLPSIEEDIPTVFEQKKSSWLKLISSLEDSPTKADILFIWVLVEIEKEAQENLSLLDEAIRIYQEFGITRTLITAKISYARYLGLSGSKEEGLEYGQQVLSEFETTMPLNDKSELYDVLFELEKSESNFENALKFQSEYYESLIEANDEADRAKLDLLLGDYKVAEQTAKAELLEQSIKLKDVEKKSDTQKIYLLVLIVSILVVSLSFMLFVLRKNHESKIELQELAYTDSLTGAANRLSILRQAKRELEVSRRFVQSLTIAIADLDHFKSINDKFGHDIGDLVLQTFADVSNSALRSIDYFGRYGGEEWLFILPNTSKQESENLFNRIAEKLKSISVVDGPAKVTFSVGGLDAKGSSMSLEQLIKEADKQLYVAKNDGRDQVRLIESAEVAIAS